MLISVIMPCYNAEKYLKEAIDSVLAQSEKNFELLLINDGSTDLTESIIKSYSDPRIVYLKNENNKGLIYSLNKALKQSNGSYIARIDADDICKKNRLLCQVEFLEKNVEINVVGSNAELIDENSNVIGELKMPKKDKDIKAALFAYSPFIHPSVMFRRIALENVFYNIDYHRVEDYELWIRLSENNKFHNINEKLICYRILEDSESNSLNRDAYAKGISLMKIYKELFEKNNINYTESELLNYSLFMNKHNFDIVDANTLFSFLKESGLLKNKYILKRFIYFCIKIIKIF